MTTYALPSITPNETSIDIVSNTEQFVSPFNGAIQTIDRGGERLVMRLVYRNLKGDDKAEMVGFLAKMNGMQHRVTAYNHAESNRGSFGGTPLVAGAGQTGNSLNVDGCSNNITN